MAIDFPVVNSDPSLPWLNPDTGITYIYKDGAWRVLSSSNSEDLEDIYVNVSGDNMTGDLTLGTDKITLAATDGKASFAGNVLSGSEPGGGAGAGAKFGSTGFITVTRDGVNQPVLSAYTLGSSDKTIEFLAGGSATFNGQVKIDAPTSIPLIVSRGTNDSGVALRINKGDGSATTTIDVDGSATFAGDVYVGGDANRGTEIGVSIREGLVQAARSSGNNSCFSTYLVGTEAPTATIRADGSAEFKGKVNIEVDANTIPFEVYRRTTNQAHVHSRWYSNVGGTKATLMLLYSGGGLTVNGNITANNVSFNLEPDNDDNYTVTTEEYQEQEELTPYVPATNDEYGNELTAEVPATYQTVTKTRENRVYNGPTLDVKERLQNLIARLDAIEANEVVDDATDNSLLLAVAELTSRLNERDALITTLTTRIEALENA